MIGSRVRSEPRVQFFFVFLVFVVVGGCVAAGGWWKASGLNHLERVNLNSTVQIYRIWNSYHHVTRVGWARLDFIVIYKLHLDYPHNKL